MKKASGKPKSARKAGRPTKTEQEARAVREKILEAAEAVFAEKGFQGAGLREIARRARASLAVVNYYFKTKEKLIVAVYERHLQGHQQAIAGTLERHLGRLSLDGLREIFRETLAWYGSEAGLRSYRIQLSSKLEDSEELAESARNYWSRSTGLVGGMIRALNPALSEAEALERALFLLMLQGVRTELHWVYAENSGQKKGRDAVVRDYENWLERRFLPLLVEGKSPEES